MAIQFPYSSIEAEEFAHLAQTTHNTTELRELSKYNDVFVKCAVITNPHTPSDVLMNLSDDDDSAVRCHVACITKNDELIQKLMKDKAANVRCYVAGNPAAKKYLNILMYDEDKDVRYYVAANTEDSAILNFLANDSEETVRYVVEDNPFYNKLANA